jgi:hypothetical protein
MTFPHRIFLTFIIMSPQVFNIILYIFVIIFAFIGMSLSLVVLLKMFFRRKTLRKYSTDYLLLSNSYLVLLCVFPFFTDMSISSIYGNLYPESSFDGFWCRLKSYLTYINGYVYFYSFLLEAIYRFCRVVYHTQTKFHSFRLYAIASICLWINGFWQMLPSFFFGHINYMPNEYHCQFPVTYLDGSLIGLSIMFAIPYILTVSCYMYTICCVRQRSSRSRNNQRLTIRRDLIICKRITVLFTLVTLTAMPHVIIPIYFTIFGHLSSWICPFEWLITVIALTGVAIIQILMFPFLRKLFFR